MSKEKKLSKDERLHRELKDEIYSMNKDEENQELFKLLKRIQKRFKSLIESSAQAKEKPSEAEVEEIKDELAKDIKGWFMRWRSEYPEENKDIEELPHQNAKNMVSILLKKYNEQRR